MQAIIAEKNKKLAELRLKKEILELQHEIASRRNYRKSGQPTEWRDSDGKSKMQTYLDKGSSICVSKHKPEMAYLTAKLDEKRAEHKHCLQKHETTKNEKNVEKVDDAKLARIEKDLKALLASQRQELQSSLMLMQNKLKSQNAESLRCEVESVKRFTEQKLRESMLSVKQECEYTVHHNVESSCVSLQDDFTHQLSEVQTQLQEFHDELESVREYYTSELTRAKRALRDDFQREVARVQLELENKYSEKVEAMRASQEEMTTVKLESLIQQQHQQNQSELAYLRQLHKMELGEKLENFKVEWELRHKNLESKLQNVKAVHVEQGESAKMFRISETSMVEPNSMTELARRLELSNSPNQFTTPTNRCLENTGRIEGNSDQNIEAYYLNVLFSNTRGKRLGRCVCRFLCKQAQHDPNCHCRGEETTAFYGHVDKIGQENADETDATSAHQIQEEDVEHESCLSDDDMDMATMVDSFVEPDRYPDRRLQSHPNSENQDKVSLLDRFLTGSPRKCKFEDLLGRSKSSDDEEDSTQQSIYEKCVGVVDQPTKMAETGDGCIKYVESDELRLIEEAKSADKGNATNVLEGAIEEICCESNNDTEAPFSTDSESGKIETQKVSNDQWTKDGRLAISDGGSFQTKSGDDLGLQAVREVTSNQGNPDGIFIITQLETEKWAVSDRAVEEPQFSCDVQSDASCHESTGKQTDLADSITDDVDSTIFAEKEAHAEETEQCRDTTLPTKSAKIPCVQVFNREALEEHQPVLESDAIHPMVEEAVSDPEEDKSFHAYGEGAVVSPVEVNSSRSEGSGRRTSKKQLDGQDLSHSDSSEVDPLRGGEPEKTTLPDLFVTLKVSTIDGIVSDNLSTKRVDNSSESVSRNSRDVDYHTFTAQTDKYILEHEVSEVDFNDDEYDEQDVVPYHTVFLHKLPVCDNTDFNVAEATNSQNISFQQSDVEKVVLNGSFDAQDPDIGTLTTIVKENIDFDREVSELYSEDDVNKDEPDFVPLHSEVEGFDTVNNSSSAENFQGIEQVEKVSGDEDKKKGNIQEQKSSELLRSPRPDQNENEVGASPDPSTEERSNFESFHDHLTSTVDEDTCSYYSEQELDEEEDCSTTASDDGLVPAEELNIEDDEEMELRKRALALLGIGI